MPTPKRPYRPQWPQGDRSAEPAELQASDKGDVRLAQALAADRAARVLAAAQDCPTCAAARADQGDDQALCDDHLGQALGVTGGWALGPAGRKLHG